jgi:hypothetical protein
MVKMTDKKIQFEFIAAVPMDKNNEWIRRAALDPWLKAFG